MAFKIKCNYEFTVENDNCVVCYATPVKTDTTTMKTNAIATHISAYTKMPQEPFPLLMRFKGVAIRNSDDDVNIELAKEIAKRKAMRAATKAFERQMGRAGDIILDFWDRTVYAAASAHFKAEEFTDEIKALANSEDEDEDDGDWNVWNNEEQLSDDEEWQDFGDWEDWYANDDLIPSWG